MIRDGDMLGHLHTGAEAAGILDACTCISCTMPFLTSQFMPRKRDDRPPVLPEGTRSLAFVGQFVEVLQDVVFTVEYSIRSAHAAVHSLLGLQRDVTAVYQGKFDPGVLPKAVPALHDVRA